ncbi:tetratricopeptide repeat protein [Aurantivibrio plasticivorans]
MTKQFSMSRGLSAALLALPIFLLNPVEQVHFSQDGVSVAVAEAAAQNTRKVMAVSEAVNKKLAAVNEFLNPEEGEANLPRALQEANDINTSKWNEFEQAQLYNLKGNIYVQMERYKDAIANYRKYVDTPSVPEANQLNVSYYLAQLYLATENYKEAVNMLEDYIKRSEIVGADHYYKLGQAYYLAENLNKSLPNINKAVDMYEGSDRIPPEGLYQYQMSLYHTREEYSKVIEVLEKMIRHYPKTSTWRTLAQMYGVAGRSKDQLHAYSAVYTMGGLTKDKELRLLASLYLENDYPYKAAKVLDKGIKDKIVEPTAKNLELLGVSWSLSKEKDESIKVMEQAAKKSDDGELYARLSQMYLGDDNYQNAVNAGKEALKRKLKRPASVHFNLGISYFNMEKYDSALKSLKEARKNKDITKQANQWIRVVEGEKERVAKLEEAAS